GETVERGIEKTRDQINTIGDNVTSIDVNQPTTSSGRGSSPSKVKTDSGNGTQKKKCTIL
ncbi:hypothetical protein PFISCL1PPCAC_2408, partial [Pristionchus fissidentatus]